MQELFPGTQVTIGPVIEDGFYYDFAREEPFSLDDLAKIEQRMKEIVDRDEPIQLLDPLDTGTDNEMMLIRACAVFDPIFPMTGLGLKLKKDAFGGGYAIIARSAFVNEPE